MYTAGMFRHKRELSDKILIDMNEKLVCKKIIYCTNRTHIKKTGQYLNRVKSKFEYKVRKNSKLDTVKKNVKKNSRYDRGSTPEQLDTKHCTVSYNCVQ
jgi:hypothetical protein